ncbi:MAG: protease modulator HflC [Armatimonadota bacterium]
MMNRKVAIAALIIIAIAIVYLCFYTVDETEVVIVAQFGKPVLTMSVPGLHLKAPFWQVRRFDRRLLLYNPKGSEFLTRDKKNIVVESYVCWRIRDPQRFWESVADVPGAENRIHDIVWSELSAEIGRHDLGELVSHETPVHTDELMRDVTTRCDATARTAYGVRIADVRIKRLNLPEQNKQSVFERMRAERQRMAKKYRAEGEEEAAKIRAEADYEKETILAQAYKRAEELRGEGDAAATEISAAAHMRDPEFYKLTRTLDAYKKALTNKTTVVLSADSELLQVLTQGPEGARR